MYQPAIWGDQRFVATCSRMHCAYNRRSSNESIESVILPLFIIFSVFGFLRVVFDPCESHPVCIHLTLSFKSFCDTHQSDLD